MSDKKTDQSKDVAEPSDSVDLVIEDIIEEIAEDKAGEVVEPAAIKPATIKKEKVEKKSTRAGRSFPWFGVFNFLLILTLAAGAGYYWQLQQKTEAEKQAAFLALKQQVASKAESSQIQAGIKPLQSGMNEIVQRIEALQQHQTDLQASSEKLYELFGRDESGWQLAEVEYLMRIAQHKLILENDFEGSAITLQAASDRIASTGDLGLLPVRVKISDEIAELKTHKRADLVGMTLKLSQLAQQIRSLKPGFQPRINESPEAAATPDQEVSIEEQVKTFFSSLVSVTRETTMPPTQTEALIINVEQILEDNLKLTRWSVLERDAFQYSRLMKENVELFKQYYNLDNAANHDFYSQLQALQKAEIKPEKPDINGSLEMLKRIISKRDEAEKIINEDADNV